MRYLTKKIGETVDIEGEAKITILKIDGDNIVFGVLLNDEGYSQESFEQANKIIGQGCQFLAVK